MVYFNELISARATLVRVLIGLLTASFLCEAKQLLDNEQLQARLQTIKLTPPNSTADLSHLINETLTINNKTVYQKGDKNETIKDDWTFDMVEYDLIEFLQDLNARYRKTNQSDTAQADAAPELDDQVLESRRDEQSTDNKESVARQVQAATTERANQSASGPRIHPTSIPVLSTSLASGEPELAESSWQYGIFDRFTRARSTTTTQRPTTEDPQYSPEAGAKLDVRNFNNDECGLRTYEDVPYFSPEGDMISATAEEQQQMNPLLKREKLPAVEVERRKYQLESVSSLLRDRMDQNGTNSSDSTSKKNELELGEEIFANFKERNLDSLVPENSQAPAQTVDSPGTDLVSRRAWLQQQIGNTLQKFGMNITQSISEPLNNGLRENMMSKRLNKLGRSSNIDEKTVDQKLAARQDELKLEARVIGGSNARLGDSPWSVSLQALVSRPGAGGVEYRHYCGGTIISEYYVLTAAHCLDFMVGRESRLFVVVGDINWRMSTTSLYGRRFGIEKLIIHSGYKSTAFGHDIGLIKTKESMKPLKVNGKYIINSVCLPNKGVEHSGEAELVGWGLFSNRNEMADQLQIADVPVLPRPLCVDLYRRRTGLIQWLIGIELITEKQVCAGTFGRGICQGDSGSALVVNEKISRQDRSQELRGKFFRDRGTGQTRATHIGIVAFGGIRRCSYQSLPGVYMQTSKYLDWLLPRIQNQ